MSVQTPMSTEVEFLLKGICDMCKKVKKHVLQKVSEKCQTSADESMFYTSKRPFFNTEKHFETKIGCTFCHNCAVLFAIRIIFNERCGFLSIKKRLRVKKSSLDFFTRSLDFFTESTFSLSTCA